MYRDFYKLGADPFRLTPDPAFVLAHQSYLTAQTRMRHALEQGDGILVVTGGPGTGKTTLIANFLSRLPSDRVLTATVVGTSIHGEGLLRMVGCAFGLDASNMDKAAVLCELQDHLAKRPRALLVIDEAQNLTAGALGEVHVLSNLHTGSRPLLQIFLVGQEELHETLQAPQVQQLHQQVMGTGVLEPTNLQETHDYILHRLHCAGWRGNPAIVSDAFILIHRFSQGLPRYTSKLCARLLEHGARHRLNSLNLDDVVTVIEEMRDEKLLPRHCESHPGNGAALPQMQDLVASRALPTAERIKLTVEEHTFLETSPRVVQSAPSALVRAAKRDGQRVIPVDLGPEEAVAVEKSDAGSNVADSDQSSPLLPVKEWYQETGVPLSRSAGQILGWLLASMLAGIRYLGRRSRALQPVARSVWRITRHSMNKAWSVLKSAARGCRGLLSDLVTALGPRQAAAGGFALLLVVAGTYLVTSPGDEPQQESAVAAVEEPKTGSLEIATVAEPEATVDAETPEPERPAMPEIIESPVVDNAAGEANPGEPDAGEQEVAISEPAEGMEWVAQDEPAPDSQPPEPIEPAAAVQKVVLSDTGVAATEEAATEAAVQQSALPEVSVAATPELAEPESIADVSETEALSAPPEAAATNAQIEEMLSLAEDAMARDRLRIPAGRNAWHYYNQVLELDADNRAAQDGMQGIASRYGELAMAALYRQEYDRAEAFVQRGLSVVPDKPSLVELQQEVYRQRQEMYAQQQKTMQALSESETVSQAPAADTQPESKGLFGTLKRFFKGNRETP